jgi:hypothetical protein
MADERARDHFDSEEELQEILDKAEENARTDKEIKFVDEMTKKVGDHGINTFMSDAQAGWLKKIAKGE